jgi:hypothetical protein
MSRNIRKFGFLIAKFKWELRGVDAGIHSFIKRIAYLCGLSHLKYKKKNVELLNQLPNMAYQVADDNSTD